MRPDKLDLMIDFEDIEARFKKKEFNYIQAEELRQEIMVKMDKIFTNEDRIMFGLKTIIELIGECDDLKCRLARGLLKRAIKP